MENDKQEREYLTNLLRQNKSDTGKQDIVSTVAEIIKWHEAKVKNILSNTSLADESFCSCGFCKDYDSCKMNKECNYTGKPLVRR